MFSTGSPLAPESFDYVYQCVKHDVCLSSISGGTDICRASRSACPTLPVWRGEIQCRGLGMDVDVFDEDGHPVARREGRAGVQVAVSVDADRLLERPRRRQVSRGVLRALPGRLVPRRLGRADRARRRDHLRPLGRDAEPGGVRIGTAEIYRQVEQLPEIVESLVIGQDWPPGEMGDVRVVLFVKLQDGMTLDDALVERIKAHIRANTTPRHVPAKVVQVTDIPRTKSGKIVELAVRDVVHGRDVQNLEALANPEALEQYRDREELET